MKYFFSYFCICLIFLSCGLSAIFSYPVFSQSGTLTSNQQQIINDENEDEKYVVGGVQRLKVISLNWFDAVNTIFTKYKNTRVIDVQTGTIYYVQRTGGYNHADVEPIDKENMLKFYGIYNNEWSWVRRPVWVEINGMWVAGSINGMPHGYSLITDNGQDGHTCIHFEKSKTHGTKRVDEAHQEAVQTALKRGDEINYINLDE